MTLRERYRHAIQGLPVYNDQARITFRTRGTKEYANVRGLQYHYAGQAFVRLYFPNAELTSAGGDNFTLRLNP
jgi:hypothetical protein